MSLQDALPVGSVVLPAYLTTQNKDAWARQDIIAAMLAVRRHQAQQKAMNTIVSVVKRLVETATFTLSVEDFAILEAAIKDYDNT